MTPDRERRYIDEIETLQEENRQLKERLGYRHRDTQLAKLKTAFEVSPAACKMLLTLYRANGRVLSKEDMMAASDAGEGVEPKGVDVRMCQLRKSKLGGGAIRTIWGQGYQITPEGKKIVQDILDDHDEHTRV